MEWMEIPQHRILVVPVFEIRSLFETLNAAGEPCPDHDTPALIIRKSDRKVFKPARFEPSKPGPFVALEEI